MKSFIVFSLFVAAAVALPVSVSDPKAAETVKYTFDNIGVDGYSYAVETNNGISASENAVLKNVGSTNEALEVRGQFSYVAEDGKVYTVTYVADENGFQPIGEHLPK